MLDFLVLLIIMSTYGRRGPGSPIILSLSSFRRLIRPTCLVGPSDVHRCIHMGLSGTGSAVT